MQEKLSKIKTALLTISGIDVYHFFPESNAELPYIVWYESGEADDISAENHKAEQAIEGNVIFYTATELDSVVDDIQDVLNSIEGLSWRLTNVTAGDPAVNSNNIIRYMWEWTVI